MRHVLIACVLAFAASPAFAQTTAAPSRESEPPVLDLDTIVVTGVQPGPGMWKVSKGEHVLWVLGTQSPLPRNIQWVSRDVDAVLAQAQEVISPPSFVAGADVGFIGKLALLPSLIGLRKNPGGKTLQQVVPAEIYARWQPLKRRYLGRSRGVETWRPIFAAMKLYDEALEDSGLAFGGVVGPVVAKAVKQRGIKRTQPTVRVKFDEPKATIREFRASALDDVACFDKTLRRLEIDIDAMTLRANAWATGDLDTLRALPAIDNAKACQDAALQSSLAQRLGIVDAQARTERAWLDAASSALARNRVTFATLPIAELLRADGYLAGLVEKGYLVEAP